MALHLQNHTPPIGKQKKKSSKSDRKRRKREREHAEAEALATKEKDTSKRKVEPTTSVEKAPETDVADQVVMVPNASIDIDNHDASNDVKLKLVNETGITSRKILFVYPKKDKASVDGKLVSYVHSKFRKSANNSKLVEGNNDEDANEKDKQMAKELMNDSIDDILFPKKKKRKNESESMMQDKNFDKKADCDQHGKKKKYKLSKEDEAPPKKRKIKDNKRDEGTKSPETPRSVEKCHDNNKEKKEVDLASSAIEQNDPPIRGRSRSDSLSDPMKIRLSGRTVEDAVQDASGRRPRSNSTDSELNLPKRGLCDERVVIRNYKWDLAAFKRTPPRGFINLGNTCFLNSTLQCLSYLPTFCQSVAMLPMNAGSGHGSKRKSNNGLQMTMFVRSLLRKVHGLDGEVKQAALAPKQIVKALSLLGGSHQGYKFRPGRQEDAHEFLVHLLDAMNDGELKAAGIDQNKSGWRDKLPIPRLDETTLTHRMFGGYLRSQVHCTKCKYKSNTYDPFLDLSLEVSGKKVHSLYDALSEYTRKETLDAENKWKCSGCKKRVCATKQLTVFRPPLTLCIQLKRFSFGSSFGGFMHHQGSSHFAGKGMGVMRGGSKVQKQIEFPSNLKLPLSDGRKCEYELTGVVVHIGGSATSGHYTAFVRQIGKQGQQQWLNMDDSFVDPVHEKTVLRNKDAYVLFYCRKEVKLELPSPPPVSFTAEEAVKAGHAKAKAKAKSLAKSTADQEIAAFVSSSKKTNIDKNSFTAVTDKIAKKEAKQDEEAHQSKQNGLIKKESPSKSKSDDSRGDSGSGSEYHTTDEEEHSKIPPKIKIAKNHISKIGTVQTNASLSSDLDQNLAVKKSATPQNAAVKKKEIALDMGSMGRVKVMLRKLNKKNKRAWKPSTASKFCSNEDTGLLGNRVVSTWDDDNAIDDAKSTQQISKETKLRQKVFTETKLEEKDRKRKMYLNNWDAGLDAGKLKKIKEKVPTWEDQMPKENPFHRIQEGMLQMKHGPKGYQQTSMKKRKRATK